MNRQHGWTIVELVLVVVLVGVLSVTAAPKFFDVSNEAREANIRSAAASFEQAVELARAQHDLKGVSAQTITFEGNVLYFNPTAGSTDIWRYPTSANSAPGSWASWSECISLLEAFLPNDNSVEFSFGNANSCTYQERTRQEEMFTYDKEDGRVR